MSRVYKCSNSFSQCSKKKVLPTFTRQEVAKHNTEKDLWLIINKKVYNFSGYAKVHPGGSEAFFEFAGLDATECYDDAEHPKWIDNQLDCYLVGELVAPSPLYHCDT